MILADTSVWVEHFRRGLPALAQQLQARQIACHPVVIGELACGNLARRAETLAWLQRLPPVRERSAAETMTFLENHRRHGRGLGGATCSSSPPPMPPACRSGRLIAASPKPPTA